MEDLIKKMIEEKEARERAAKEEAERIRAKEVEALLSEMKEYLGDFWTLLEDRAKKTGEKYSYDVSTNNGKLSGIFYQIPAIPEEELAPITIKWGIHASHQGYYDYKEIFHTAGSYYRDLGEALAAARKDYPAYLKDREKKALEGFWKDLPHTTTDNAEEIAARVFESYVTLYPDLIPQAREKYEQWKGIRANWIRNQEADRRAMELRKAEETLLNTIRLGYVSKLAEWMKESDRIAEANKEAAARIQAEADRIPYSVYKLTFAMIANYYEEGEEIREIETRSVYTLQCKPDSFGFWEVKGKPTKYFNDVSLEMEFVKASSGICARQIDIHGLEIFFKPGTPDGEIMKALEPLSTLPPEPKKPEELSQIWDGDLRREARSLLNGEDRFEDF